MELKGITGSCTFSLKLIRKSLFFYFFFSLKNRFQNSKTFENANFSFNILGPGGGMSLSSGAGGEVRRSLGLPASHRSSRSPSEGRNAVGDAFSVYPPFCKKVVFIFFGFSVF